MFHAVRSSKEIRHLVRIISCDARYTVFRNVQFIKEISGLSPWDFASWRILQKIENSPVPANNEWRLTLLLSYCSEKTASSEDCDHITQMIESLCNT